MTDCTTTTDTSGWTLYTTYSLTSRSVKALPFRQYSRLFSNCIFGWPVPQWNFTFWAIGPIFIREPCILTAGRADAFVHEVLQKEL